MKRICPNPIPWQEAFDRLTNYAELHPCTPPSPPKPLILNGWVWTNDVQKMDRWEETTTWAENNGCTDLVSGIPEQDFYFVDNPTSYAIGPGGGPMYRAWDFETKSRPVQEQLDMHMNTLFSRWPEIVGRELASITRPVAFTGEKARRLLVLAESAATPPWGGWSSLSTREPERRTFTNFRAAINEAIAPHEIDHIDFTTELKSVQDPPCASPQKVGPCDA
jgi:hypothetical protein